MEAPGYNDARSATTASRRSSPCSPENRSRLRMFSPIGIPICGGMNRPEDVIRPGDTILEPSPDGLSQTSPNAPASFSFSRDTALAGEPSEPTAGVSGPW